MIPFLTKTEFSMISPARRESAGRLSLSVTLGSGFARVSPHLELISGSLVGLTVRCEGKSDKLGEQKAKKIAAPRRGGDWSGVEGLG